jgi:hypothetical protein
MQHVPVNAVFIDMLVNKADLKEMYTEFESKNARQYGMTPLSEIVAKEFDGYVSYTFHCVGATSDILLAVKRVSGTPSAAFVQNTFGEETEYTHNDEEKKVPQSRFRSIRFAYLSKDGAILAITNASKANSFSFFLDRELCTVSGEVLTITYRFAPPYWTYLIIPSLTITVAICMKISTSVRNRKKE